MVTIKLELIMFEISSGLIPNYIMSKIYPLEDSVNYNIFTVTSSVNKFNILKNRRLLYMWRWQTNFIIWFKTLWNNWKKNPENIHIPHDQMMTLLELSI